MNNNRILIDCYKYCEGNMNYLFEGKLDNTIHNVTMNQLMYLYEENKKELKQSRRVTQETYNGRTAFDYIQNDRVAIYEELLNRQPRTDGVLIKYPYGTIIQQSETGHFYRGENKIYTDSTPSLYRKLKQFVSQDEKNLYRLVADMRIGEFKKLLNCFNHVKEWHYCDVLYDALAQHYGLETDWLDITSDFNVALFFATCFWDNNDKRWKPLTKKQTEIDERHKYGMIFHTPSYRIKGRQLVAEEYFLNHSFYSEDSPNYVAYPIGFQPFMRCHMQNGYAMYMRKPNPLQKNIDFEKLRFRHSEELSNWIYDKMEGGKLIYPHEGLNEVDFLIKQISELTIFSKDAFKYAIERNNADLQCDEKEILNALQSFKINGKNIVIKDKSEWHLSSGRRKKIDRLYSNFSVEEYYNIKVLRREILNIEKN